jgi:hypothetical protein
MNKIETFNQFLATSSANVSIWGFVFNLLLAFLLSYLLGLIYIKYGHTLSNRKMFSKNLVLITMTTMLIITIVKSSLALSLGLVGALSIVRFRTALKEPEELSYTFLSIAIGLGFGAHQGTITIMGFIIIGGIIILRNWTTLKHKVHQNLHLTISSHTPHKAELAHIVDILKQNSASVDMKRLTENKDTLEVSLYISFTDFLQLNEAKRALQTLDKDIKVNFVDNSGIIV